MLGSSYVIASWRILCFYAYHVGQFGKIHPDLPSGKLLAEIGHRCATTSSTTLSIQGGFGKQFNHAYQDLQAQLRRLLGTGTSWNFEVKLFLSFTIRALWGWSVWTFGPQALAVGVAQFLVAPMSFVVCILRLGTNLPDCILHYILNAMAGSIAYALRPWLPRLGVLRIDFNFAVAFLVVDFLLNLLVYFSVSEPFGFVRLMKHITYGTFNTKTYFIVVLGTLCSFEVDLSIVLLTGLFTLVVVYAGAKAVLLRATRLPCFPVLFYCEHRLGHLPGVYQDAHKMHHYLHDTTAFDAHIYGSGMHEEFFWILAETLPCLAFPGFLFPYFLNLDTLWSSWTNKGGHSRTSESGKKAFADYDYDNFHADHHTLHRANFGSAHAVFLDFYFGTQGANTLGAWGKNYSIKPDPDDATKLLLHIVDREVVVKDEAGSKKRHGSDIIAIPSKKLKTP